jgi:hypothetical protein
MAHAQGVFNYTMEQRPYYGEAPAWHTGVITLCPCREVYQPFDLSGGDPTTGGSPSPTLAYEDYIRHLLGYTALFGHLGDSLTCSSAKYGTVSGRLIEETRSSLLVLGAGPAQRLAKSALPLAPEKGPLRLPPLPASVMGAAAETIFAGTSPSRAAAGSLRRALGMPMSAPLVRMPSKKAEPEEAPLVPLTDAVVLDF